MASEIKVDNIKDQCGSAVVTKCGASKTLTVTTTKADNYQAADGGNIINQCGTTITLGASGDTITLACGASQTGFGRTGTVDWDTTAKTASFTAVSGNGYFVNTTSGAITVTLPATPSAGDIVSIADYTNTWQTNSVTVARNGSPIGGISADASLSTEGQSVTFIYVDGTEGWKNVQDSTSNVVGNPNLVATGGTITTCGNCKIHTFTGPGTFTVINASSTAANNIVSYLVVGGGGSSGNSYHGGGGAGGVRELKSPTTPYTSSPLDGYPSAPNRVTVTAQAYPITVGAGASAATPNSRGSNGSNSIFSTITSAGGGAGGVGTGVPTASTEPNGNPGGSGGGAGSKGSSNTAGSTGGSGNTPPVSPAQGQDGGSLPNVPTGGGYTAAGGGGATAAGGGFTTPGSPGQSGGAGGAGATTSITASSVAYGGGGGGFSWGGSGGSGGTGGGGCGGNTPSTSPATNGTVNTGGGAGGGPGGGAGGSGIVVIRYKYQ